MKCSIATSAKQSTNEQFYLHPDCSIFNRDSSRVYSVVIHQQVGSSAIPKLIRSE